MITYEHPLNERVRTLLRLEDLYERVGHFMAGRAAAEHHVALTSLFEILEVGSGSNLKSDLLQELERQRQVLSSLRGNPAIAEEALSRVLTDIDRASSALLELTGKIGQHLRDSEWLMSIKQRSAIPGGVCEFDLPAYHHWLHRNPDQRSRDLKDWAAPLLPIRDALAIVLRLLRDSGKTNRQTAQHGVYQQMLSGRLAQMVRLSVDDDRLVVPEISANKYALNIRFISMGQDFRARQSDDDVAFDLTFCNL